MSQRINNPFIPLCFCTFLLIDPLLAIGATQVFGEGKLGILGSHT